MNTSKQWLADLFEYENCEECHQGEENHTAVESLFSGHFALCNTTEGVEKTEKNTMEDLDLYPISDWKYDVANGDTRLGYTEWVEHNKESHEGE